MSHKSAVNTRDGKKPSRLGFDSVWVLGTADSVQFKFLLTNQNRVHVSSRLFLFCSSSDVLGSFVVLILISA